MGEFGAHRHKVQLRYAALPSEMDADPLDFGAAHLAVLFDLGVARYIELTQGNDIVPLAGNSLNDGQ